MKNKKTEGITSEEVSKTNENSWKNKALARQLALKQQAGRIKERFAAAIDCQSRFVEKQIQKGCDWFLM